MIDVNTIIGDPIQALNNTVIIPISKVGFGFAAGGCEFNDETVNSYNRKEKEENIYNKKILENTRASSWLCKRYYT